MGHLDERAGLAGRVGIVVGGGGGLGRACALDLGRAGVRLALCDKDAEGLADVAAELGADDPDTLTEALDARDPEALEHFFERADEAFGRRLDILVNVVGGTFRQPFEGTNPRGWDALIRANFTWLLTSTHLAIPRMRAAGRGSIINLTSIEAHRAAPNFAVYAAMKAGVTSLTRSLALELAPDGIRINTIAPDYVPTPNLRASMAGTDEERAFADQISIPMGRAGTYEDVGGCALFLASDLSSFVTGTSIHPDGGAWASSGWLNWPDQGYSNHPPLDVVRGYLSGEG